jgi:cytosine deaminase
MSEGGSAPFWLRGVRRPTDAAPVDVHINGDRIDEVRHASQALGPTDVDGSGQLLLPGLIDSHCHVDKTLWGGPWVSHSAGPSIAERIADEQRRRFDVGIPSVDRITALLEQMISRGTTHVRTHTDVDPDIGLRGIRAVNEAVSRLDGSVHVEQVAFPQSGILSRPGTEPLLAEAVKEGAVAVGGLDPCGCDNDPRGHLGIVFGIAERLGCAVDIHLHDGGELGRWQLRLIAERTRALGLQGRVAVGHAFCLGEPAGASQAQVLDELASAGISVTTAAVFNRPLPPVMELNRRGVNLSAGNDAIRDLWSPFGNGDMLERASLIAYRSDLRRDEELVLAFETATLNGARTLGLRDYGLEVGCVADLLLVEARNLPEAVVSHPTPRLVIKGGEVVARNGTLVKQLPRVTR